MAGLVLKHVCKTYPNGFQAVKDFNLEISEPEFVVLSGPEGCGKSTLLKMIAGLEEPTAGKIYIGDRDVTGVDPKERRLAMLFKNSTLYPGMTVYDNMAFALRMSRMAQNEIDRRIGEAAEILGIAGLLRIEPEKLTSEERIKALLGRAVVRRPEVLLLDGILSGLDAELREKARKEFLNLHKRLGITIVYVTDNPAEAMELGTKVVAMQDGVIRQAGTPMELYRNPNCIFVAGFVGEHALNMFLTTLEREGDSVRLRFQGGDFLLPGPAAEKILAGGYLDKEVALGIRPEAVRPVDESEAGKNGVIRAELREIETVGDETYWHFGTEESGFMAKTDKKAAKAGDMVCLSLDLDQIYLFDRETKKVI